MAFRSFSELEGFEMFFKLVAEVPVATGEDPEGQVERNEPDACEAADTEHIGFPVLTVA